MAVRDCARGRRGRGRCDDWELSARMLVQRPASQRRHLGAR